MDVTITTASGPGPVLVPVSFLFWAFLAAYVVHILDESVLGETFVGMVRRHFWPDYGWEKFFGFNALLIGLIALSNLAYEALGGAWIILPLVFAFQMATNGLWHLGATLVTRTYSPGLLTSVLYWMLFYLLFRYAFLKGQIRTDHFLVAAVAGTLVTVVMIGSLFVIKRRLDRPHGRGAPGER